MAEASVLEEDQVEPAEALGVGDLDDLDDLPATDREAEYHKEPSTRSHDDSHGSVDEHRSCGAGTSPERPPGHGRRTADLPRCASKYGTAVCSEHDVRVEHREQRVEVAAARGGVLSVASDDDRPPLTVPLWYGYEPGGNISFFTGTQGRKARKTGLIERAGVLSLSVQREEFPYKHVTVEGTVVGEERPPSAEQMLAIARRYLPGEAARAFVEAELGRLSGELVLFTVRPDRWLTADFAEEDER